MKSQYPDNVINKILQITLETQTFAYLAIDNTGVLANQGGNIDALGLPAWSLGDNILDDALFLSGFIPMPSDYETIPMVHITENIVVDIHLFHDSKLNWAILIDKTDHITWQNKARQKANELSLLQQEVDQYKKNISSSNSDDLDVELFEALNIMVFQLHQDEAFKLLKPVPKSFLQLYPEAFESSSLLYPHHKFLFIENFLIDAHQLWDLGINNQRITSGPWIEKKQDGTETALEAKAINWNGKKLLFIEIQDSSYQQNHDILQLGREGALLKKALEKEVSMRTKEIRAREEEIALRLICAADTRDDGETGSHIRRLGLYSELMARHLNWRQDKIDEIRIAAPMHDIGKIGIPDNILKKPGKLSDEEFDIMKTHSKVGAKILSNSKSGLVKMAQEISLWHHEKWDGSGYPDGLCQKEIPVSARIVAIVDVFDALIHERVYKKAMPVEEAIEIMTKGRGTHFDPVLFDLFIQLRHEMSYISEKFNDPLCFELDTKS